MRHPISRFLIDDIGTKPRYQAKNPLKTAEYRRFWASAAKQGARRPSSCFSCSGFVFVGDIGLGLVGLVFGVYAFLFLWLLLLPWLCPCLPFVCSPFSSCGSSWSGSCVPCPAVPLTCPLAFRHSIRPKISGARFPRTRYFLNCGWMRTIRRRSCLCVASASTATLVSAVGDRGRRLARDARVGTIRQTHVQHRFDGRMQGIGTERPPHPFWMRWP